MISKLLNSQYNDFLSAVQNDLQQFIKNPNFSNLIHWTFGDKVDAAQAKQLIQNLADPNFSKHPILSLSSAEDMNGAQGAYSAATDNIYLSSEFLAQNANNKNAINAVFLEELGHALDARLNHSDSLGDEGELFSALVRNAPLSAAQLQRIQSENDQIFVTIDGSTVSLEQSNNNLGVIQGISTYDDSLWVIASWNYIFGYYYATSYDYTDYYTFQTVTTGSVSDFIFVTTNNISTTLVDIDIALRNSSGTIVGFSGTTGESLETISLINLPADTYTLEIYDYKAGANLVYAGGGTVPYKIGFSAPTAQVQYAPTGDVTISNTTPTVGDVLTVTNTLADQNGLGDINYTWRAGSAVLGTGSSYKVTANDIGKKISVAASYTDGLGQVESASSQKTSTVIAASHPPTGEVVISNPTPQQGQTLVVTHTLADLDGLGKISFVWKEGTITIGVGVSHILTQSDVGKSILVIASYTDLSGTTEVVSSAATARVQNVNDSPTGSVTITGTAKQGEVLTASNTLADLDGLGAITYQWKANNAVIATGNTYTLSQANVGKTITAVANYTDQQGTAESVNSMATATVLNGNDLPTGLVTITGIAQQGEILKASNTLADLDGLGTITYQWKANNAVIATGDTYTLSQADVGKTITAVASYTDQQGSAESVNSMATATVLNGNDLPTGSVTITGTAKQGESLKASNTLADLDGLGTITYQWKANNAVIATGDTYTLSQADVGKTITAVASYTDQQGTIESLSSAPTDVVRSVESAVILSTPDLFTSEDGDTAIISVSLATAPSRLVSISFKSSDLTEGAITQPKLSFNTNNWSIPQNLTIVGKNDYSLDPNQPYIIKASISSSDVHYRQLHIDPITLTNREDLTTAFDPRIPIGTPRDMPIKLYGDTQVDTHVVVDGFFKQISSFSANDVFNGLDGNDTLYGLNLQDDLSGGIGNDTLYGGNDQDFLYGQEGNDVLYGEQDADILNGGAGNDALDGGLGLDTLIGGTGNDTYYLGYDAQDVIKDNGSSTDIDTVIMPYQLTTYTLPKGIENGSITAGTQASDLMGNDSDNNLTGNEGNNHLNGAVGDDTLIAGAGNDSVDGGEGNDEIVGGNGLGDDDYFGGADMDTLKYTSATSGITVKLANGNSPGIATGKEIGSDQLNGIENIIAGQSGDNVTGNDDNNLLDGFTGNDSLSGGVGNDILIGGMGADVLTGHAGADSFKFNTEAESGITRASRDTITDFNHNEGDKINLLPIDANVKLAGNNNFTTLTVGNAFKGLFTDVGQLYFDKTTHILYGNNDADSSEDFSILLTGVSHLLASDLLL